MSLVIHRNKNHSFQVTSPWQPVTSSFGNLLWLISKPTPKCNLLNIPIDMEMIAWRAADTHRTFYGEILIPATMNMDGFSMPERKKRSIQIYNWCYQHKKAPTPRLCFYFHLWNQSHCCRLSPAQNVPYALILWYVLKTIYLLYE